MKCCVSNVDAHFLPLKPLSLGAEGRCVGYTGEQEKELPKNNYFRRDLRVFRWFVSPGTRTQSNLFSLHQPQTLQMDFEKPTSKGWALLLHI